jgi:hypothetical protein
VDTQPLASGDKQKLLQQAKYVDNRTCGYKQRIMAQTKAPLVMLNMLHAAVTAGIHAKYVLCDSWFSAPANILTRLSQLAKTNCIRHY